MSLFALLVAQAAQSSPVDAIVAKLAEYGVAALALYALIYLVRNNGKQDSAQADLLRESIKLNGKMVEMVDELKEARKADNAAFTNVAENLTKNDALFFQGVTTLTDEVKLNTKATIDHYRASAETAAGLREDLSETKAEFNERIDKVEERVETIAVIAEEVPEVHARIEQAVHDSREQVLAALADLKQPCPGQKSEGTE